MLKKVTSLLLAIALVPMAAFSAAAATAPVVPKTVQNAVKVEYNKNKLRFLTKHLLSPKGGHWFRFVRLQRVLDLK
ncbi:hypothetical protein [Brevibacillus brevis]|uniref:hypothetical protein n=1 Tax=Brevibacillus brevis TaxID=1393 RepID=UPI00211AB0BF|nr:hypothetical protein [Brevibacillus brevis]